MDIFRKLHNNPGFEHLVENIIGFMDIDKAMEIMIENDQLSESERKFFKTTLNKLMFKEAKEICEKHKFFEIFPWWQYHLENLKNRRTLESFNELYDILVLLQELLGFMENPEKMTLCIKVAILRVNKNRANMIKYLKVIVKLSDEDAYLDAMEKLSYPELLTLAIQSAPEQRLTLSQIYEWMVKTVPYFKDRRDSPGWRTSIRHTLHFSSRLHGRFKWVQNEGQGESDWWMMNPDAAK